ncbi:isopenicillin N synthase family oxygenase [Actinomadura viridis]|uniref:Isopenicillin N synthase-like dioxygenase n=1 Tax=Actinomadura viridis TaxID=58110 RepID=A0A931DG13_9ACTN|nr:isopenicillin N synthase family oxygenase [Actinomadura viridis]MBG6088119.1 isopenicillin N synthase-like dioxygenase [Actinomadura viridis]
MSDPHTFRLPAVVTPSCAGLGRELVQSLRTGGILHVRVDAVPAQKIVTAMTASRRFFSMPLAYKARHVSDLSFSGYLASRDPSAEGEDDHAETFTVCKDVPYGDARVRRGWPCHGPVPWPDPEYRLAMRAFMDVAGGVGERVLRLVALGLGWSADTLTRLTADGWHTLRVARFPARPARAAGPVGAHTDHGLLTVVAQSGPCGMYVRPPVPGEKRPRNWVEGESTAGLFEDEEPWHPVRHRPDLLSVFPGDLMQLLTDGRLPATPHKTAPAEDERHTLAYSHEPGFETSLTPIGVDGDPLHYGTHFTAVFMRRHPDRPVTRRILDEGRLEVLERLRAGYGPASGIPVRIRA